LVSGSPRRAGANAAGRLIETPNAETLGRHVLEISEISAACSPGHRLSVKAS
jgi:hypothetical protein